MLGSSEGDGPCDSRGKTRWSTSARQNKSEKPAKTTSESERNEARWRNVVEGWRGTFGGCFVGSEQLFWIEEPRSTSTRASLVLMFNEMLSAVPAAGHPTNAVIGATAFRSPIQRNLSGRHSHHVINGIQKIIAFADQGNLPGIRGRRQSLDFQRERRVVRLRPTRRQLKHGTRHYFLYHAMKLLVSETKHETLQCEEP